LNEATTVTLTILGVPSSLKFDKVVIQIPSNYQVTSYVFTNSNNSTTILINPVGLLNPVKVTQ